MVDTSRECFLFLLCVVKWTINVAWGSTWALEVQAVPVLTMLVLRGGTHCYHRLVSHGLGLIQANVDGASVAVRLHKNNY